MDIEWRDDSSVICPRCGYLNKDLWDYDCGEKMTIIQRIEVSYGLVKKGEV
jgi:hypothetical protein